ncbi:AraC family transcriptional regulator [Cohnella sp. AR92]|uniref:AraC family transcriptional regulator n=1 Tax=Cohnella sp. AR92 TaxID=648716 RepID=UPI000F8D041A|nr:AraC family transcriptional regulator [Cohnella sp. AR92]RUS46873.1 AraC family transcriptional regulator [Cohnella sp. AR92]
MQATERGIVPQLVYIGKVSDNPNWKFPSHRHENVSELIFVARGRGVIKIDRQLHAVEAGDLLVYNQGVIHEECSSPACPLGVYYCGVKVPYDEKYGTDLISRDVLPQIPTHEDSEKLQSLFAALHQEFVQRKDGFEIVCSGLLTAIIALVRRMSEDRPPACKKDPDTLAARMKEYLDRNYLKHLALNDIAEAFHMNAYYLAHVFKDKYDDSPINYMLRRRMEEATRLLMHTDMKVVEIAGFLGYENANYFTNLFRKTMGESPTQFKKKGKR